MNEPLEPIQRILESTRRCMQADEQQDTVRQIVEVLGDLSC